MSNPIFLEMKTKLLSNFWSNKILPLSCQSPLLKKFWQGQMKRMNRARVVFFCSWHIIFFFFFFFFFDLCSTALSRIFHLYQADRSSKVGENRRTRRKTTWPSVSRTWLSHIWPERGSNHSSEIPNGDHDTSSSSLICVIYQGTVVQSIVSLTSSLVVKMLSVLTSTICNSQVYVCWKKCEKLHKSYSYFFSAKI